MYDYIEYFIKNSFILFGILVYSIFMSEKPKDYNKKIIVVYILMALIALLKIISIKNMLIIFVVCFIIYFEILIEDEYKNIILRKLSFKLIDFLYLLNLKYLFPLFVICIFTISNKGKYLFSLIGITNKWIILGIFTIIFVFLIYKLSTIKFELNSFTKMYENIQKTNFGNFKPLDKNKKKMLLYLEDRTFDLRKNNYTILCFEYLKYQKSKIKETILHPKGKLEKIYRGYSTIEMQLFRQIAIKSGYEVKHFRKITEFIYTPMFFKGLKDIYKSNYKEVSQTRYKEYIISCYLKWAPVFFNHQTLKNIDELFKNKKRKTTDCDFLVYLLCLSSNSLKLNLDKDSFLYHFSYLIAEFNITDKELDKTLTKFKEIKESMK